MLKRFSTSSFKKVAHVVMGEPTAEYKKKNLDKVLAAKQAKADRDFKFKKAEKERKKQVELRQKQLQEMRKKAEEARKKAAEEARKRAEELKKKAEEDKLKADAAKKAEAEGGESMADEDGVEETKDE